jgi:hypothetical protein
MVLDMIPPKVCKKYLCQVVNTKNEVICCLLCQCNQLCISHLPYKYVRLKIICFLPNDWGVGIKIKGLYLKGLQLD